jgi:hypothetical protein
MPQLSIANSDLPWQHALLRITIVLLISAWMAGRQRVWGSMDQELECYRYALHSQPCRHRYRGQLTKSSGIQIQGLYQRTSRTGLPVGFLLGMPKRRRNVLEAKFLHFFTWRLRHVCKDQTVSSAPFSLLPGLRKTRCRVPGPLCATGN